jgi:transmembrane sensor
MSWFRPAVQRISTASKWFERVQSGRLDSHADRKYTTWIASDMEHQDDYASRELAWELTDELRGRDVLEKLLQDVDTLLARGTQEEEKHSPLFRRGWRWAASLPVAAAAVALALFLWLRPTTTEYRTAIGEQRVVTLADQSSIALNTATTVRVVYSRSTRRVELIVGEALFSVKHDTQRSFDVIALDGVARAVGTQFVVQLHNTTAEVSVLEGTVILVSPTASSTTPVTTIAAGMAVDYGRDGRSSALRAADISRIRGWQSHKIVFNDMTLADAIEEYNRYAKIPISLTDSDLASRRVHGVFKIGDEDTFVRTLEQVLPLKVSSTDNQITLLPR